MAEYFIKHPIQGIVAALLMVLLGVMAAFQLPVAEYPEVAPPTVSVSANYLGADADVVRDTVAEIIETEIRGIEGLETMISRSDASGGYQLDVEFSPGTNGDIAAVNIQNRIASVQSTLPVEVQDSGIDTKRNSPGMVFAMSLCSPKGTYDSIFLQNYAKIHFIDKIKRVSGVGSVMDFTEDYAMRIWLQPDRMAARGLTVADVREAVLEQNVRPAVGVLGKMPTSQGQEKQQIGRVQRKRETPEDFGNIILKTEGSDIVRLKDVARVAEGRKDTRYASFQDGEEAAAYGISLMNDANALQTIGEVKRILAEEEKFFPPDMECRIVVDRTDYIKASMAEVLYTLAEAMGLVLLIVYLFLGNGRATLVTLLTVPVSLIATLVVFKLLGFSINLLTLFAMVLAIGLVVDDAIVVIECVSRHRERGLEVQDATLAAMREVQAPILAIFFVLAAVFLPVAFLEGTTGILYRQFALTIVTAMGISAFAALSLTPALCVLLLNDKKGQAESAESTGGVLGAVSRFLQWLQQGYMRLLGGCLRRIGLVLIALVLMLGGAAALYGILPSEFLPEEDQGYFLAGVNLPPGTSLNHTIESLNRWTEAMGEETNIRGIIGVAGVDFLSGTTQPDSGVLYIALKNWEEREGAGEALEDIMAWAGQKAREAVPEARVFLANPPAIAELSSVGGATMYLQDVMGHTDEELWSVVEQLTDAMEQREELEDVETEFSISAPYMDFEVDEDKAKEMGVNLADVYQAMQINFGGEEVNNFTRFGRVYKVVMQGDTAFRDEASALGFIFVRNEAGKVIPLTSLVKARESSGPTSIARYNGQRSIHFEAKAGEGHSLGEAMAAMEEVVAENAPEGFQVAWSGESRQAKKAQGEVLVLLGLSLICIFLCLVALYESWSLPLVVLFSLPVGIGGALLTELVAQQPGSIYMQIGILLVIALAAKNAILIVEFAKERAARGASPLHAAMVAAKLRLRPILMTSLAFVVGCLPLVFASGAGSAARSNMGLAVTGGMTIATVLGIFIVPVLFVVIGKKRRQVDVKSEG